MVTPNIAPGMFLEEGRLLMNQHFNDASQHGASISVAASAVTEIARSGIPTSDLTDDVQLAPDDYVFLVGQTSAVNNGVWQVKTGAWVRHPQSPVDATLPAGLEVYILGGGTLNGGRSYKLRFSAVVGTDSQNWGRAEQNASQTALAPDAGDITELNVQSGIEGLDARLIAHRQDASAAHAASAISSNAPSGEAAWTDVQAYLAGLKALVDAGGGGGSGGGASLLPGEIGIHYAAGGFTDTPAAGSHRLRNTDLNNHFYDTTNALSGRLFITTGTTGTGLTAHAQYSSDGTSWFYVDGTADGSTPTTSISVLLVGSTRNQSSLVTLPAGARGARHWRVVITGGDGVKTVNYSNVWLQFNPDPADLTVSVEVEWVDRIAFQPNDLIADQFSGVWYPSIARPARLDAIKIEVDQAASATPTQLRLHRVTNNGTLVAPSSATQIYPATAGSWTSVAANFSRAEKTEATGEGLPLTLGEHDRFQLERGSVGVGVSRAWMTLKGVWL